MKTKKVIILKELKRVAKTLGKERFSRDELYKHSTIPITQNDIENEFGSFAEAMVAANLKPIKWSKISDETLFKAYDKACKKLGHYPLGHPGVKELSRLTPISGHTFRHRFGGLKNFLFEYKNWLSEKKIKTQSKRVPARSKIVHTPVIPQQRIDYFDNKQRYIGKAAENLVLAELLFKGFNAQILPVDEGIDIIATNIKKNELYLIQVKHSYYEKPNRSRRISITKSSFEKNRKSNVYYIIVLARKSGKREFLILPFHKVDELTQNGSMKKKKSSKRISFSIQHKGLDNAMIGTSDVSRYLDAWDLLL